MLGGGIRVTGGLRFTSGETPADLLVVRKNNTHGLEYSSAFSPCYFCSQIPQQNLLQEAQDRRADDQTFGYSLVQITQSGLMLL